VDGGGTVSFRVGPRHTYPVKGDGGPDVSAEIGPVDYPDSYKSPIPFISDGRTAIRDPAAPGDASKLEWYCFACSFRPWIDSGDASTALVTVVHADGSLEQVGATEKGDRWVTDKPIAPSDTALVGRGCVQDRYGDYNGTATSGIGASAAAAPPGSSCPVAGAPPDESGTSAQPGGAGNPAGGAGTPSGGPEGGVRGQCRDRVPPRSRLRGRDVRASRRHVALHGHTTDRGCGATATLASRRGKVGRVYVSLAKVKGRHQCRFLQRNRRLGRPSNCRRAVLFRTRGTSSWRISLRGRLPAGLYRVVVRAYDASGNKERPAKGRNIVRFRVR
jgi:hypothetical protein